MGDRLKLRPLRATDLGDLDRFATDPDALGEVDNVAELRALERIGFQREGTMRQAVFRSGSWRDLALYSLLREDGLAPE